MEYTKLEYNWNLQNLCRPLLSGQTLIICLIILQVASLALFTLATAPWFTYVSVWRLQLSHDAEVWRALTPVVLVLSSLQTYASEVLPSSRRHESDVAPCSNTPTASCSSVSGEQSRVARLNAPDCIRFSCCSPIVSASAAAPWLCPLPRLHPLYLLLPDCIHFTYYSPIASTSPTTPRLCPLSTCDHAHTVQHTISMKVMHHQSSPAPRTSHFCSACTHATKILI